MKNQVYSRSSLARFFRVTDFYKDQLLRENEEYKGHIVDAALGIGCSGFLDTNFSTSICNGKVCYSTDTLSEKLILRALTYYLKSSFGVYQKNRNRIVDELVSYLKEGTPYRIYRLDIKSFYESCSLRNVEATIEGSLKCSFQTKNLAKSFFDLCYRKNIQGVPRGVEISSVLADLSIRGADSFIKGNADVVYYARYVDDILIVTTSFENQEEFLRNVESELSSAGYRLNETKQKIVTVEKIGSSVKHYGFDFLGYSFDVFNEGGGSHKGSPRCVDIDLSLDKLNKLKIKICKAFYSFGKKKDFGLLRDRILFLSTNRKLNGRRDPQVLTGIYYNYSRINKESVAMRVLDKFLKYNVISTAGRLAKVRGALTAEEIDVLKNISFSAGHKKRIFKEFSPHRSHKIGKIWR